MNFGAAFKKRAVPFYPMPNTGTVLDISAGNHVKGHKGQTILNGGYALFWCIAALPNMFKSALAAALSAAVLRAFVKSQMHVHDTETTMVHERVERLTRLAMHIKLANIKVPENLMSEGRMFFTSSVDYNGTEVTNMLKEFAKQREKEETKIELEILDPSRDMKPYKYYTPVIEFWDSLSGLKAESATTMLEEGSVGTKDLNMLAMRVNSGKSQIVEQAPDLTAKHGIYLLTTAHVGQTYQLDPNKPNVKVLKHLKGDIKLKRVPENLSFQTGNCYVITKMEPMMTDKKPQYPYAQGDDDTQGIDLIQLTIINQRGKFGISGVPLPMVVSQKNGLLWDMSNFTYLKEHAGKFGIVGTDKIYSLALTPDLKVQRTTIRQTFRQNYAMQNAARVLMEMHWMFTYWTDFDFDLVCEPVQLYEDIKKLGYDWDLLLNTRYWFMPIEDGKDIPFLSTMDLLNIRAGRYHPYWYPKSRKEMGLPPVTAEGSVTTTKE